MESIKKKKDEENASLMTKSGRRFNRRDWCFFTTLFSPSQSYQARLSKSARKEGEKKVCLFYSQEKKEANVTIARHCC